MMLAGVLATAAGAAASITFEAPVKVGVAGEPGYCYGLDADGLGTATRRPTLSAVCGTAHGDVYTASGGASWAPIVSGEAGKGTINELFHTADGTLRTVPQGHANAGNASWSGTSLGFSFERGAGAAVVRSASNRTTAWTGLFRGTRTMSRPLVEVCRSAHVKVGIPKTLGKNCPFLVDCAVK